MKVYLDFDGTCVEHAYPKMGRCNFGCIEVIHKLQEAGHEIILNTMRSEFNNGSLEKALEWFENAWMLVKTRDRDRDFDLKPIKSTKSKIHPNRWDIEEAIKLGELYIDDIAYGMPLKKACMTEGQMVDWSEVEIQLIQHNLIK